MIFSSPGTRSIAETTILKEVSHLVSNISLNLGSPFEPSRILTEALINTVCNLTFGCRYSPNDPEMDAFVFANHKLNEISKPGHPLDLFPFLKVIIVFNEMCDNYKVKTPKDKKTSSVRKSEQLLRNKETKNTTSQTPPPQKGEGAGGIKKYVYIFGHASKYLLTVPLLRSIVSPQRDNRSYCK